MRAGGVDVDVHAAGRTAAASTSRIVARRRRDRRVGHRPARGGPVRRDRAGHGDADAERHGDRAGRHGDGPAVHAGDGDGAVADEACDAGSGIGAERGYTFVELLVVATIVLILASAIMPLAKVTAQRQREAELRRALREMRTAIDKYKDAADLGQIGSLDLKAGSENYPPDLRDAGRRRDRGRTTRPAAS